LDCVAARLFKKAIEAFGKAESVGGGWIFRFMMPELVTPLAVALPKTLENTKLVPGTKCTI